MPPWKMHKRSPLRLCNGIPLIRRSSYRLNRESAEIAAPLILSGSRSFIKDSGVDDHFGSYEPRLSPLFEQPAKDPRGDQRLR